MRYGATIAGETVEVDINRRASNVVEAQIGDRKYVLEARALQPGFYWLNWENRSIEVVVTEKNGGYLVMLDGRQILVELGDFRTALSTCPSRTAGHCTGPSSNAWKSDSRSFKGR